MNSDDRNDLGDLWQKISSHPAGDDTTLHGRTEGAHPVDGASPASSGQEPRRPAERGAHIVLREERGILRADDDALSPDSMPVLNAFREFLDVERRRSRNRVIALSAFFTVLLLAVIGGGLVAARIFWKRTRAELQVQQSRVELVRVVTESNLQTFAAAATDQLARAIASDKAAIGDARSQLDRRTQESSNEVARLRETLEGLEVENAMLAYSVRDIRSNLTSASAAPRTEAEDRLVLGLPGEDARWEEPPLASLAAAEGEEAVPAAVRAGSVSLVFVPSNSARAVSFRLPVP